MQRMIRGTISPRQLLAIAYIHMSVERPFFISVSLCVLSGPSRQEFPALGSGMANLNLGGNDEGYSRQVGVHSPGVFTNLSTRGMNVPSWWPVVSSQLSSLMALLGRTWRKHYFISNSVPQQANVCAFLPTSHYLPNVRETRLHSNVCSHTLCRSTFAKSSEVMIYTLRVTRTPRTIPLAAAFAHICVTR